MNHDDDIVSPPAAPSAQPTPPAAMAEPAATARPPRAKWRKWLLYAFATLGALALLLIALVAALVIHDQKKPAPTLSRDAVIEESMTRNYGKYSESQQGWLYVDPNSKNTYVMQVLQRAQVEVPSEKMTGVTAVYFLVSGKPSASNGDKSSLLGMFVIQPDTATRDGTLTESSEPLRPVDGDVPVTAQDVRFEALGKDTWGWVVKITRPADPATPAARVVDDVVFAPHGGGVVAVATFPARGLFTAAGGCEQAQASREKTATEQAAAASAAQAAASAAAADPASAPASDAMEGEETESGDEPLPMGCTDASWTYRTGEVPADGFVTISVTGGGRINGVDTPVKTYKLVFDPKSFGYVMPQDMPEL